MTEPEKQTKAEKLNEAMIPESPRWDEFANALEAALDKWGCDGDAGPNVHRRAKRIMAEMGNIDIPASLAFIKDASGYCDCEILLNVDPDCRVFRHLVADLGEHEGKERQ